MKKEKPLFLKIIKGSNTIIANSQMKITKDILIEDLIEQKASSVSYLADHGIKCIACGEPIWGTLEEAARKKGFSDAEIEHFVSDLEALE